MIRYYVTKGMDEPEAVECAEVGYPHCDAKGRPQWVNRYFDDETAAWESLIECTDSEFGYAMAELKKARNELATAESALIEETLHHERVKQNAATRRGEEVKE